MQLSVRLGPVWGVIVLVCRIVAATWAGLVALALVLQTGGFIAPLSSSLESTTWVLTLLIIGVDNIGTLFTRSYWKRRYKREADIEQSLMTMLIQMANSSSIRFEDLGASVYTPKRRLPLKMASTEITFRRIKRFRPAGFPQQSGVTWTSGKGLVGACWQDQKKQYANLHGLASRYSADFKDDAAFEKIRPQTRQGMNRHEFARIHGKYSEILAIPIWHSEKDQKMLGVLTIDRALKAEDDDFKAALEKTHESAFTTAMLLARTIKPTKPE